MNTLRKDYILNRWVIISEKRGSRPKQFKKHSVIHDIKICYFCPGNENTTPKEIGRVEYAGNCYTISSMPETRNVSVHKNKWLVRWFPNLFPAVDLNGNPKTISKGFLTKTSAYGYHEVIVETPEHSKQLADLREEHIAEVLKVYGLRINELSNKKNIKYVLIFKNEGSEAGTSIVHSHTQLMAYNKVPSLVEAEINAAKKYRKCPYCSIIKLESRSERRIFENKSFASFAPYASRFNYEAWIFPKKHIKNITELNDNELLDLARVLKKILVKIKTAAESYNIILHYAPKGTDLHFHIEIAPRIAVWGGYEIGAGEVINSVSPENAAKFYRSK